MAKAAETAEMNGMQKAIAIGNRLELFVDHFLLDRMDSVSLKSHAPVPKEIALALNRPWEGSGSAAYATVIHDGDRYRMYYSALSYATGTYDQDQASCVCYAESKDGVEWHRPDLGLNDFYGSRSNNIIWQGSMAHTFAPFLDRKPGVPPRERFKAIAGNEPEGLTAFVSGDGVSWTRMREEDVTNEGGIDMIGLREAAGLDKGAFRSRQVVFWDCKSDQYRRYFSCFCGSRYSDCSCGAGYLDCSCGSGYPDNVRGSDYSDCSCGSGYPDCSCKHECLSCSCGSGYSYDVGSFSGTAEPRHGIRPIRSCTSKDLLHWSKPTPIRYDDGIPPEHLCVNAALPCPGAEHLYLSFPMRILPERCKAGGYPKSGISDSVLMSSRDGMHWSRPFMSSWIRAGRHERNWTARSRIAAQGIVPTAADEFSLYVAEYGEREDACLRRYAMPRHRFGSIHADYAGGHALTKPFTMNGERLVINYGTSGAGSIRMQLEDETGQPLDGFAFADFGVLYGDELDHEVKWKSGRSTAHLIGIPIRLRIELNDADLYALQFRACKNK